MTFSVKDFIDNLKQDVQYMKIITSDNKIVHADLENDSLFRHQLVRAILNENVENFEINFSSKRKILQIYTSMTLKELDKNFIKITRDDSATFSWRDLTDERAD